MNYFIRNLFNKDGWECTLVSHSMIYGIDRIKNKFRNAFDAKATK